MEIDLMFTGSDDILNKCRQSRREIVELVSAVVSKNDYGTTIRFLGVNVIFQDIKLIEPGVRLFRKRKEIDVEVELRMDWVRNANVIDIKLTLLQCLINAAKIAKSRMTRKDDHFESDKLVDDLRAIASVLEKNVSDTTLGVCVTDPLPSSRVSQKDYQAHQYQLVLQIPEDAVSADTAFALEEELGRGLSGEHEMDGNDIGSGTINYFIHTPNPILAFRQIKSIFALKGLLPHLRVAYRDLEDDDFENLWPENDKRPFKYFYR
ncbi:MAG: hypothetical protein HY868_22350 [Chloroflexi bacterium]|nr:hypothetical protein [Chloroflexota bacterium]